MKMTSVILVTFVFLLGSQGFSWDGRGHHSICEAAVFLVKEKGLQAFLKSRPHIMGHLCNIPDIQWRSLDPQLTAVGNPTHFIDPEVIGKIPKTVPLDLKALQKEFTGQDNQFEKGKKIFSLSREMGTSWWRVDQFMRELASLKTSFEKSALPQNKSEEQNENLEFNKATYRFLTLAGIMGHYVGDSAQPFHNSADYDGWAVGHGGIHSYYEGAVVAELEGDLVSVILKKARNLKNTPWGSSQHSTLEKMRNFSQVAFEEIPLILKADPILKKSLLKDEKGMALKTPAERKDPSHAVKKMRPLIEIQMARAAHLLALLWDQAYTDAGRPSLEKYKSYKHPFQVDFLAPDYE